MRGQNAVDERPEAVYTAIDQELRIHTGIEVHQGKTQLWNKAGVIPTGSERLTAAARVADPTATVWRGDLGLPPEEQGVKILGTPLGHPSFVRSQLATLSAKHDQLISKILHIQDLQCAWILLLYCASIRANYTLRVVHPKLSASFAAQHDAALFSTTKFHVFGCCEFAVHHGRHGFAQCCVDLWGRVLVQLGGLSGDDRSQKPFRCRHDRDPDGPLGCRVPCVWSSGA